MSLFDFLHKPAYSRDGGFGSPKETISKINEESHWINSRTMVFRDGDNIIISDIEVAQTFRHSDGSISYLITAGITESITAQVTKTNSARPICFEIPEGRMDLIADIIKKNSKDVYWNPDEYTYLGRAYSEEEIILQQPTTAVNAEIAKLNVEFREKKEAEDKKRAEIANTRPQGLNEKTSVSIEQWGKQRVQEERLQKPFIRGGISGKLGIEEYDGVNLNNGEILSVKNVQKIAKDMKGTYIYTAYLSSTMNIGEATILNDDSQKGIPVIFSLPYRINDIINSNYDPKNKQELESALLRMFSAGYADGTEERTKYGNDILLDIGGIDKNGRCIKNNRENVGPLIMKKIRDFQREYYISRNGIQPSGQTVPSTDDGDIEI